MSITFLDILLIDCSLPDHPTRMVRLQVAPREGEYITLGKTTYEVRDVVHGGAVALTLWCAQIPNPTFGYD